MSHKPLLQHGRIIMDKQFGISLIMSPLSLSPLYQSPSPFHKDTLEIRRGAIGCFLKSADSTLIFRLFLDLLVLFVSSSHSSLSSSSLPFPLSPLLSFICLCIHPSVSFSLLSATNTIFNLHGSLSMCLSVCLSVPHTHTHTHTHSLPLFNHSPEDSPV